MYEQSSPAEVQPDPRKHGNTIPKPKAVPLTATSVPPAAKEQAQLRNLFDDSTNNAQYRALRTETTPPASLETDE